MKISHNWLREYVSHSWEWPELVERLTMAGLELEGIDDVGSRVQGVIVGEVTACQRHPNADRLSVCQVDLGADGGEQTIVCGAPNVAAGQKVAVLLPGNQMADGTKIETVKIRGVQSNGMICAEDELGLGPDHDGILVLPPTYEAGAAFAAQAGLDDVVIDFEVTPNRPDCLSMVGIAREVHALTGIPLKMPDAVVEEDGKADSFQIEIQDRDGCPRYTGRLIKGVRVEPSPEWLANRLRALGMRPINNIVDITNYVMLELGQPLHAFDMDRLEGRAIVVRHARSGEQLKTLDGVERTLDAETLVIAAANRPVALAGIMGGATSEVSGDTTDILLESAYFTRAGVRRPAAAIDLQTEASARFERGTDWAMPAFASDRAAALITELAGGQVCAPLIDEFPEVPSSPRVKLRIDRLNGLLSTELGARQAGRILELLGCRTEEESDELLHVEIPSFRPDLSRETDLVEEVGRIYGYEHVEASAAIRGPVVQSGDDEYDVQRLVRRRLAGLGLDEVITNSVVEQSWIQMVDPLDPVELVNPLAESQSLLRTSLIPGLMDIARRNFNQRAETVSVFELGRCFSSTGRGEWSMLSGLWSGARSATPWRSERAAADILDLKGIAETLLESCQPRFTAHNHTAFRAGHCARIEVDGVETGHFGEADPALCATFDLTGPVFIFEFDFAVLAPRLTPAGDFQPLPRFPPIERDLALVVSEEVPAALLIEQMQTVEPKLVRAIQLFDVYQGDQVEAGSRSLAFTLELRSSEKTLEDVEADEIIARVLKHVEGSCGARLRDA